MIVADTHTTLSSNHCSIPQTDMLPTTARQRRQRRLPLLGLVGLLMLAAAALLPPASASVATTLFGKDDEEPPEGEAGVLSSTIEAIKDGVEDLHESVSEWVVVVDEVRIHVSPVD
jgi:hypothetical protein